MHSYIVAAMLLLMTGCTSSYQCIKPVTVGKVVVCEDMKVLKRW